MHTAWLGSSGSCHAVIGHHPATFGLRAPPCNICNHPAFRVHVACRRLCHKHRCADGMRFLLRWCWWLYKCSGVIFAARCPISSALRRITPAVVESDHTLSLLLLLGAAPVSCRCNGLSGVARCPLLSAPACMMLRSWSLTSSTPIWWAAWTARQQSSQQTATMR